MNNKLIEIIRNDNELNTLLMHECDIYFYPCSQEVQFSNNHEVYSMVCKAFAGDSSGGEYVFLEDHSIGFISSEGEIGRVAENLEDLLTFLLHAGYILDFNCKYLYRNQDFLGAYCNGYLLKTRKDYQSENRDWDEVRSTIAKQLSLSFDPNGLIDLALKFYKAASRMPLFSCKYDDSGEEFTCDSILSDIMGMWMFEIAGISKDEFDRYK